MLSSYAMGILHQITSFLLEPVVWGLLFLGLLALYEVGIAFAERFFTLPQYMKNSLEKAQENSLTLAAEQLKIEGKKRIERSDFITRIAPMLGLMGTLIPLGPGLAALGDGELSILTTAITVAFDTTIIGLLIGIIGFVLARMRRRWYDHTLHQLEKQKFYFSNLESLPSNKVSQKFHLKNSGITENG